ncbi:MAG: hypothetical protein IJX47_06090 [Clostridia bacterium]|nr:hypothetical protein [Clostridia bacterium]
MQLPDILPFKRLAPRRRSVGVVWNAGSLRLVAAEGCYSPPPAVSEASASEGDLVCSHQPVGRGLAPAVRTVRTEVGWWMPFDAACGGAERDASLFRRYAPYKTVPYNVLQKLLAPTR